jgi:hypothetical protein
VTGGGRVRPVDEHDHAHSHDHDHDGPHAPVEASAPTVPSRAVVINVGEHTGALVLASNERRAGIEVEIHPVSRPDERTHVWVLPREGRDGVVYAAIFPSLDSGAYVILDVDGSVSEVVLVPPNQVTHATWT